jgi:hypothetical protein
VASGEKARRTYKLLHWSTSKTSKKLNGGILGVYVAFSPEATTTTATNK